MTVRALALALVLGGCHSSAHGPDAGTPMIPGALEPNPGNVAFAQLWTTVRHGVTSLAFGFSAAPAPTSDRCTLETVDQCVIRRWPIATGFDGGVTSSFGITAATITLTGPGGALPLIAGDGEYTTQQVPIPPWIGGELYELSASGGDLPAFTTSVLAPTPTRILSPPTEREPIAPIPLGREQDFTVSWQPALLGTMELSVQGRGAEPGVANVWVYCDVPVSVGVATIPASALQTLAAKQEVVISAWLYDEALTPAGDWTIDFTAIQSSVDSVTGDSWTMEVTLQ